MKQVISSIRYLYKNVLRKQIPESLNLTLLKPISFEEPFGLSVAESMFCGTPVIAYNKGSMSELILNRKTGFLVQSIDEAIESVDNI